MNLRPLHDRVIVQRIEDPARPASAMIMPDSAKEKSHWGTVVAVRTAKTKDDGGRVPIDVKTGGTIVFDALAGRESKHEGVEYLILRVDEVLAAIELSKS